MTSMPSPAATRPRHWAPRQWAAPLRSWRTVAGLAALAGGGAAVAGSLMPWATAFAGLVAIPGTRGANGKILAAAGLVIAAAGVWHLVRGGTGSRWLIGLLGAPVLGYSSYLLLLLAGSLRSLGSDSMVLLRGGPGLWVVAAGGLVAFATLFLPASSQAASGTDADRSAGPAWAAGRTAWAADRTSAGPRRWLQVALGLVWVLDAALQFQPYMFTKGFVTQILQPAGMGSPALISNSITGTGQIMLAHVAIFNAMFATIQLALGLGLLWRRTSRAALAGSIVWALSVWWLGEALGGLLTGAASPVTGAPGAALLYVVIAVLAWPARDRTRAAAGSVAAGSRLRLRGAQAVWAALWLGFAYLILQAPNRAAGALHDAVAGLAAGEPGWIAAMDRGAASVIGSGGAAISVLAAIVFVVIAAGVLIPAATRPVLILAAITALLMWTVGQDFGGILTGQGTDPNTGPLLVLLAAAFWPFSRSGVRREATTAEPATAEPATAERSPGLVGAGERVSQDAAR